MTSDIDIKRVRDHLQALDYKSIFNELGWNLPRTDKAVEIVIEDDIYIQREIAELAGVFIFEVEARRGKIPDAHRRMAVYREVATTYHENLLIFLDGERTQSLWYWVKREGPKLEPRENFYAKGQPGDLSLGKLQLMVFDIGSFDEAGNVPGVLEVAHTLKDALDVERVTRKFYEDFKTEHAHFLEHISGIEDERDRRWYASVLLNRLMFIYFLQRKGFIDHGSYDYLRNKLEESQQRGPHLYYSQFLQLLFFEGFAKPASERSSEAQQLLGEVVYLNGGLFLLHPIEKRWPAICIPDEAFGNLLALFARYSWNLDDTPGGQDNEISPHVLGYIFEKYINQKSFGAYYTRSEMTEYLCERSIHKLVLERVNALTRGRDFETIEEVLMNLDAHLCRVLLDELPKISILDPACGSGAFLVSAMNTLTNIYSSVTGKIEFLHDSYLTYWLTGARTAHSSLSYYIKKSIITDNLFGVDLMEEATEIAKLRLFLALVSSVHTVEQLEPLPNIDFNILPGNSLIGLLKVNEEQLLQVNLFQRPYQQVVAEKNRRIRQYRDAATYARDLRDLRDSIQWLRSESIANMNELLLDTFMRMGIKYEQATWDSEKNSEGRTVKRDLTVEDIERLHPFHWGYEFDRVMNERGGFDIIITNPPWEILKPQAKEFFNLHSNLISKNKMRIEDFEEEKAKLLQDPEVREAWLDYQSQFPHQSAYFRSAPQYAYQVSTVQGKKQGTDINLYKLFLEQCYNLLRKGGECGIVIPSGIYTDLGAKQLRELLFTRTLVTGLFCFENNKGIFEGVHRSFKFVVLTFEKGGQTERFPGAFMRHEVKELARFPRMGALPVSLELVRRLSPDSLSIMEFKSEMDVTIARKMIRFPLLGERKEDTWNVVLSREFDMTNDSKLFRKDAGSDRLPLYEGKMIHQFSNEWSEPRYWIDEKEGRRAILARQADTGQKLEYQYYRLGYRAIGRTTDQRALIATMFPSQTFAGNSLIISRRFSQANGSEIINDSQLLFVTSIMNSFIADYFIGQKISANLNMFYIYQLPVPRLTEQDTSFRMIVDHAARLICTTPAYKALWETVMPVTTPWSPNVGATDKAEREKLRAELDGIIAHIYRLTQEEFQHILDTFPLIEQTVKDAALAAYHEFMLEEDDPVIADLIRKGENEKIDFKVAACWNAYTRTAQKDMREKVIEEVAAFMNKDGGMVLIGVADDGTVVGLEDDYKAVNPQAKKQNRDGYQLFLNSILVDALGGANTIFYNISFHRIGGKDVCCITVDPATEPVYVHDSAFYVRNGNSSPSLNPKQANAYVKQHWVSG